MDTNATNFIINKIFRYDHDITWSFQYSLCGNQLSDGGFTTFLLNSPINTVGGEGGIGLGIGSSTPAKIKQKVVFCVAVDSTGLFGSSSYFATGLTNPIPNSMTIRVGNDFQYLTSFPLSNFSLNGQISEKKFDTIKINFGNISRSLYIYGLDHNTNNYIPIFNYTQDYNIHHSKGMLVGFSQSCPVSSNNRSFLTFKDIHVQGKLYGKYYLLQSQNSDHFLISKTDYLYSSLLINTTPFMTMDSYALQSPNGSHILLNQKTSNNIKNVAAGSLLRD